nr:MAG TPA: hypothetical protein [Caudoviricetes sp.]
MNNPDCTFLAAAVRVAYSVRVATKKGHGKETIMSYESIALVDRIAAISDPEEIWTYRDLVAVRSMLDGADPIDAWTDAMDVA